jgi:hypothetical protein
MTLSHEVVATLLGDVGLLIEDRIDDLINTYGKALVKAVHEVPGVNVGQQLRPHLEKWAQFDPNRRKKYLPWIVKQIAQEKLKPSDHNLDHLRDQLRAYERLVAIPEFEGSRDIFSYDWPTFDREITANLDVRSQSEKERRAKEAKKKGVGSYGGTEGVTKIAEAGPYELLEIKDAVSLSWWSWKAYDREFNPNWKHPTIEPPSPEVIRDPANRGELIRDGKWCVRVPSYGLDYIKGEPTKAFYMVLKNGGPYVGILLSDGQWKNLDNRGIDFGIAEEIYPVVKGIIAQHKASGFELEYEGEVFENLRFVRGEVKEGEIFEDIDLSGASVTTLPKNCHFRSLRIDRSSIEVIPSGTVINSFLSATKSKLRIVEPGVKINDIFDASYSKLESLPPGMILTKLKLIGCPIASLPENLEVKEELNLEGTLVSELPKTLKLGGNMTWSAPLDWSKIKGAFYYNFLPRMHQSFLSSPSIADRSDEAKAAAWKRFKVKLWDYFQTDPKIYSEVGLVFTQRTPEPPEDVKEEE